MAAPFSALRLISPFFADPSNYNQNPAEPFQMGQGKTHGKVLRQPGPGSALFRGQSGQSL